MWMPIRCPQLRTGSFFGTIRRFSRRIHACTALDARYVYRYVKYFVRVCSIFTLILYKLRVPNFSGTVTKIRRSAASEDVGNYMVFVRVARCNFGEDLCPMRHNSSSIAEKNNLNV